MPMNFLVEISIIDELELVDDGLSNIKNFRVDFPIVARHVWRRIC
jgi:hypothetical protein